MSPPRLSVVIPTYRRPDLLSRCVTSLDRQDEPGFEAVVADDGSGGTTARVLAGLAADRPWLRIVTLPANGGPGAARNAAADQARGELLLFLDDDVEATPSLVATHLRAHERAGDPALAVLGRVDWHPSLQVTPFMRWLDRSGLQFGYETWLRPGPVAVPAAAFYTANLSVGRRFVLDAGGFDTRFRYAAYEDTELAHRLTGRGMRMTYDPAALVFHTRPIDLRTFADRMEKVGRSAELMRRIAPDFPIDDQGLRSFHRGRAVRWRAAAVAALRRDDASRGRYYWATVAAAYARGRSDT